MHILCTICSDLVNQAESIYVTKCGHIFHHHCLAQWIERSKSCPQCRNKVTDRCMFRLYPTISNDITTGEDVATLQSRLDDAQLQLRQTKTVCKDREEKLLAIQADLKKNDEIIKSYEKKLVSRQSALNGLREQVEYLKMQNKETQRLKEENVALQQNMQLFNGLNNILNATCEDVEKMLQGYTDVRTVATFATALKRGLCESEAKNREIRDKLQVAKQQIGAEKATVADLQAKLLQTEDRLQEIEQKYQTLSKRKAGDMSDSDMDTSAPAQEIAAKQMRSMDLFDFSGPVLPVDRDESVGTLVRRIENADSPYLTLKQSSLALSALQRAPKHALPVDKMKPSELAIIKTTRNAVMKRPNTDKLSSQKSVSIFNKKESLSLDTAGEIPKRSNICYDGLGGHSKLEIFPVPNNTPNKNFIPKLTAKHRLKRPTPVGSQDISKMLDKMRGK
ncbi:hypothetical protein O3G_MSEX004318 [Manduca sexta]|uniref:RING-type domain-containing protein n=1 Tax=Manduca sexta TaxID=7130 RepID=A0A922CHS5_MANSE|nr:hypothetical protein O3G_MSEX004318 [Manduca sexta]